MAQKTVRRILTVGHSYVLRSNRRLAEAMQRESNGEYEVTVAAPRYYEGNPRYGDLRPERLQMEPDEIVKVVGVPILFSSRVHFALYGYSLRRIMASGFDVIQCWEEPYVLSSSQMARWAPRNSILTYFTAQNIAKKYPPPFNWLEAQVLKRADGWIAAATLVEDTLRQRTGYRDKPHRIIGLGVDEKRFKANEQSRQLIRSSLGWGDEMPVIGYLGRFTEAKGLNMLMKVFEQIEHPWRAILVGSGPLEEKLRIWSKQFGNKVQIKTSVSHEAVPAYLNAMDILYAPSQTTPIWREQFGRMLVEAFACQVPIIASDSGEIPFVVADAGIIVSESDVSAHRSAINRLIGDVSLRRSLASKGYSRMHEHFTWSAIGTKYLRFFESLLSARNVLSE